MRPAHPDQMRELMGAPNLASTAELKAAQKAAKANYGAELQAQMRANEEAKLRDRMERLGIGMPPPLQAPPPPGMMMPGSGPGSPGAMGGGGGFGFGNISPRAMGGLGSFGAPPPGYGPQGQGSFGAPGGSPPLPPSWGQPPPYQPPGLGPSPFPPPYPPGPPMGGNPFGMRSPSRSPPRQPPFMGGGSYGPQPPNYGGFGPGPGPGGSFGPGPGPGGGFGGPPGYGPPGGGYGGSFGAPPPLLPGPAPPPGPGPNTMQRIEQQARKDQYRLELEAQIREREERRAAEKARQRDEDMRKEAEMAAYQQNGMGRGGGGAPHRDAAGNVVTNLGQMNRMGPLSPGRMGGPGMGMGMGMGPPPPGGMGMGMGMGPPMGGMMGGPPPPMGGMGMGPPPMVGSPPGGGGGMMGGMPQPGIAPSPSGMGMGMGMGGPMDGQGPGGPAPNYRFRSDNPYITPAELDNKQRQARELQEALEQQIAEKRRAKEREKEKEMAEDAREEARIRADAQQLAAQEAGEEGGNKDRKEVVADAWEKARLEAEELRRKKFAAKRGGGGGGAQVAWSEPEGQNSPGGASYAPPPQQSTPGRMSPGAGGGGGGFGGFGGDAQPPPLASRLEAAAGRPPTPLVVEKVRQVAAAELAVVKQELAAEAAQLREVVAAQGQQVAALKSHAERMEAEAERAREQVAAMRVGLLAHGSLGPSGGGGDPLDRNNQLALVPAPALVDIGLDLPPTGAALRRSAAPLQTYDMGPAIPGVNSSAILQGNVAASSLNANPVVGGDGVPGRPGTSTMGLRTINPLEASMAGESVFIYPNGREMGRYTNAAATAAAAQGLPTPAAFSPVGGIPFQSLQMAPGALPTVMTAQELETGPVPITPASGTPGVAAAVTAAAAAGGAAPMVAAAASPGGARRSVSAAATVTPLDVDAVNSRNQEKLAVLKSMAEMPNGAASIEALDEFLSRYAAQRPGLPGRTATPVLRLATPPNDPAAGAAGPGATKGGLSGLQTNGLAPPIYSSRVNSVGPLPMGDGRVMTGGGGGGPRAPPPLTIGTPMGLGPEVGASSSSLKLSRRNSFTGDRTLQEGVLSQCVVPEPLAARPKTGPESSGGAGLRAASPPAGRPPLLSNNRYSGNGKQSAGAAPVAPALSRPSSKPLPVGTPTRPARSSRQGKRGSDDGSYIATSGFPSYNPSRTGSGVPGPRPLSRSRSASGSRPNAPLQVPPPPEDTLDVEMRKGLGAGPQPSPPGLPKRPGSQQSSGGDPAAPTFPFPRSPMLAGAGARLARANSTSSQRAL